MGIDGQVTIIAMLMYIDRRCISFGLDMLEIRGLNNNTTLVIVQEKLPKFDATF